jgi:hypothetical protein
MQDTVIRMYLSAGSFKDRLRSSLEDQRGQATAEYVGVVLLLVAVVAYIVSQTDFGEGIANAIKDVVTSAIESIGDAI